MNFGSMSRFQLIFLSALVILVLVGVGMFALNKASNNQTTLVTIWGTIADAPMQTFLQRADIMAALTAKKVSVKYSYKDPAIFDQNLVESIADGSGPDAVMVSQDAILQYLNKVILIPYTSFPQSTFKDAQKGYVQEAELFLMPDGIFALPFTIDPMVMYWNRNLLANAGIASPPQTWTQLYGTDGMISKINKIDSNHNILKTSVALGTYSNVFHAKDILSMLMMQAGSPIVGRNSMGDLESVLNGGSNGSSANGGAQAALSFYTQFADPIKSQYSWNSALPLSRDTFTSGDLALYLGYASERNNIYARNPNLNFDVASVPQSLNSPANITFGKIYGLALLKSSKTALATVANALIVLTSSASQSIWSQVSGYPPITRDLLASKPSDPFMAVFYKAALQSRGWLDPNRTATEQIFGDMINSVLSGNQLTNDALLDASTKLQGLFSQPTNIIQ